MRSRKKVVAVARVNVPPLACWIFRLLAARTKVWPSPAAAALNVPKGLGGVTTASTAPVAVARTSANCRWAMVGLRCGP